MQAIDATTTARIMAVLDDVPDPEIPAVTVTDLGIVRGVRARISERGRQRLERYGIAPPPKGIGARHLRGDEPVACPRCGSFETNEVSRFGSTPCKALWSCLDCLEPFDRFKCH